MNTLLKIASYIPVGLLSLTYASHGIMSLMYTEERRVLAMALDPDQKVMPYLLIVAGLVDCAVAILLFFKNELLRAVPWKYVFLYAGLWPIVPRIMEWYVGNPFPGIEVLIFGFAAALAWYLQHIRSSKTQS